jgi:hypothetical protein
VGGGNHRVGSSEREHSYKRPGALEYPLPLPFHSSRPHCVAWLGPTEASAHAHPATQPTHLRSAC